MRKRDRRELERYVRHIADEIELRDWTISVHAEVEDAESAGEMTAVFGRKHGHLAVCKGFKTLPATEQRQIIVHELLHCQFAAPERLVRRELEDVLGAVADGIFWNAFKQVQEYAIDSTAAALAKPMPLIKWPA